MDWRDLESNRHFNRVVIDLFLKNTPNVFYYISYQPSFPLYSVVELFTDLITIISFVTTGHCVLSVILNRMV